MIESVNNERVKYFSKLNDKKYQNLEGKFLVEGEHLVEEAYKGSKLLEVIVLEGNEFDYPCSTLVCENVMKKISTLTNVPKIIGVVEKLDEEEIKGTVLLLDRISDPGNLGTIIRSAVAFNIDTIVLGSGSVSLYNNKVVRATEGLMFHINIIEYSLIDLIPKLKRDGYKVYSTNVLKGKVLGDVKFDAKTAIVMGNEGSGVSSEVNNLCDEYLYIKMNSTCESLNVGVATSIILYELDKSTNI